jgi:hypothetical protein
MLCVKPEPSLAWMLLYSGVLLNTQFTAWSSTTKNLNVTSINVIDSICSTIRITQNSYLGHCSADHRMSRAHFMEHSVLTPIVWSIDACTRSSPGPHVPIPICRWSTVMRREGLVTLETRLEEEKHLDLEENSRHHYVTKSYGEICSISDETLNLCTRYQMQ